MTVKINPEIKQYCSLQERRRNGPFIRPGTFGKLFSKKVPLSAVVMTFVFGKGPDTVGIAGGILTIVQMIIVIGTILPTENALKKSFDEYGRRR